MREFGKIFRKRRQMNFTFGIITGADWKDNNEHAINEIIDSIERQGIPNYEVLIVGPFNTTRKNTKVIEFDENQKFAWITRKRNIIAEQASHENIVFMCDYIKLLDGWYEGYLKFGNKFKICMNPILNTDGARFRDWLLWDLPIVGMEKEEKLLPYDMTHLSQWMYISGSYWVVKREVMLKIPMDEEVSWGQGEDIIWSYQARKEYDFQINTNSSVKLIPQKQGKGWHKDGERWVKELVQCEIRPHVLDELRKLRPPRRLDSVFGAETLKRNPILRMYEGNTRIKQ